MFRTSLATVLCSAVVFCLASVKATAEPFLAVRSGLSCSACHTNPTGGGQRNAFGNLYAQKDLPSNPATGADLWTGEVFSRFTVGGDARVAARQFDVDGQDNTLDFVVDEVVLYGGVKLNEHVSFYLDQQVAPGGSLNREAWIKLDWEGFYLKAGRMFLPFGWRLQDNSAVTRAATGVDMLQGDDGVEFGFATAKLEGQLSVTNGSGGGGESDDGKLVNGRLAWVESNWQLGASGSHNDTDFIDRTMFGLFAGLNTGPVTWLAEYDWIEDEDVLGITLEQQVALLEANWLIAQGHNLKATLELQDIDDESEDRYRGSLVYEYNPWMFTQLRIGIRMRDSDDPDPFLNSNEGFVQLHAFF